MLTDVSNVISLESFNILQSVCQAVLRILEPHNLNLAIQLYRPPKVHGLKEGHVNHTLFNTCLDFGNLSNDVILRVSTDSTDACKKEFYDIKSLLIKGCRF